MAEAPTQFTKTDALSSSPVRKKSLLNSLLNFG